jgi:hypothetical protein
MDKPLEEYYRNLQPFDIADIQRRIVYHKGNLDFFEGIIDNRCEQDVVKLTYEDLFFGSPERSSQLMDDIWNLLKIPPLAQESYDNYLRPTSAKINWGEAYSFIPNVGEIQRLCGNNKTGWLYK